MFHDSSRLTQKTRKRTDHTCPSLCKCAKECVYSPGLLPEPPVVPVAAPRVVTQTLQQRILHKYSEWGRDDADNDRPVISEGKQELYRFMYDYLQDRESVPIIQKIVRHLETSTTVPNKVQVRPRDPAVPHPRGMQDRMPGTRTRHCNAVPPRDPDPSALVARITAEFLMFCGDDEFLGFSVFLPQNEDSAQNLFCSISFVCCCCSDLGCSRNYLQIRN